MSVETTNTLTLGLVLLPWALWMCWEVYLLIRRARREWVKTISMVARDYRHRLTSLIFLTSGMCAHWWVPWREATVVGGIAFWLVALGLVAWDVWLWGRELSPGLKVARTPVLWLALGFFAGLLLFPQAA